jgi:hypothetical protein
MTDYDPRLMANGNCILTEFDDNHRRENRSWEHNLVAARWSPSTGWTYPT